MNAFKLLLAAAALNAGSLAMAQTDQPQTPDPLYVYLVGKQDAQHILISEVFETTKGVTHDDLVALFQQSHPEVPAPNGLEGLSFESKADAEKSRVAAKEDHEKKGRSVVLLEARKK